MLGPHRWRCCRKLANSLQRRVSQNTLERTLFRRVRSNQEGLRGQCKSNVERLTHANKQCTSILMLQNENF